MGRPARDDPGDRASVAAGRPPSVERLLAAARPLVGERDRDALLDAARWIAAAERERLMAGASARAIDALAGDVAARLDGFARPSGSGIARAINATGVIIHTNLGRAPWPEAALEAARAAAAEPLLLEMDRASGRRGARFRVAEDHLVALTGGQDALVVNNNAAAVALAVGLAGRAGVVLVSRGELVEIGGGVRIPDIVRRAGARLVEVGTTNRTRLADFEEPLASGRARLVLRVHPSNFAMTGFVEAPDAADLAALAHRHGALVVDDLGSGALLATEAWGLAHEPTPAERLAGGADLVCFSGDKLVGGPQAGLIAGRADLVARLRRDPLARAARPDKATLAAVAATLGLYRAGLATREIPVWRAIAAPRDVLEGRARVIAARVQGVAAARPAVIPTLATVGGGSLPGETMPSWGIALDAGDGPASDRLLGRLRAGEPAVVGRIERGRVVLDLRTVAPAADDALVAAIASALAGTGPS